MLRVRSAAPATFAVFAIVGFAPSRAAAQQPAATPRDTTVASSPAPPPLAGGQRDTAVYALPELEVHGSILPAAAPRIGSGVPARISILSRQQIEAWEPRILPDVLASQAGVSIYDDLGTPYKLNISTRGFTAGPTVGLPPGISVFLDGVRQNEPDAQEVNFDLLPMEHIKRVELLSGTASLLGPNSLGGAINLITDRGEGPPHGEVELEGGSFGAYSGQVGVSALSHGWDYYLSGGYERENGWRHGTSGKDFNGFLNLGHGGATRGLRLQAFTSDSRVREAGSLPESLFRLDPAVDFTPGDYDDLVARQVSFSGYAPVGAGQGSFTAYVRAFDGDRFNVNQAPDNSVLASTRNRTLGLNGDWRWSKPLGSGSLDLRFGADAAANAVRVRLYAVPADQMIPQGAGPTPDDSIATDVKSPSYDVAGYSLADLHAGPFTLSGGARYDVIRIPFRNLLNPAEDQAHVFHSVSPRAGLNGQFGRFSAYASVGTSFRAPAILELGCADPQATCPLPFALGDDPALHPVRATTYELGGRYLRSHLSLNGSVYRSEVRDEIFFIASQNALMAGYFTNLPRTRRAGVELSAQGDLGPALDWYANYAYTHATFQSAVQIFSIRSDPRFASNPLAGDNAVHPGDELPLVPAHQAKAGLLAHVDRFSLGVDGRYIGHQWLRGDEANQTHPLAAYGVVDARTGVSFGPYELSLVADNLLDSRSATFGTFNENRRNAQLERFLTPLTARTFRIILRRQIGGSGYQDPD